MLARLTMSIAVMFAAADCLGAEATPNGKILHCGFVIDPAQSAQPMAQRTIVIEAGRIVGIEPGYREATSAQQIVDLRDAYCLPGLIDSHTHLGMNYYDKGAYVERVMTSPAGLALQAVPYARITLLAGFTTVRDVGSWEGEDVALKHAIERGDIIGPRMFIAAHPISATGGHADHRAGFREDLVGFLGPEEGIADGPANLVHATRVAIRRGADLIKFMASGGVKSLGDDGTSPQFSLEEMQAIVATAKDHGRKVTAHAHGDEAARRAVMAGVSAIEHGTYLSAATLELMKKRGVYLVATVSAGKHSTRRALEPGYFPPLVAAKAKEVGPRMQAGLQRAYRAGVPIALGSDAGSVPHGENAREFQFMVEAGVPPLEAIRAATQNAADLLGRTDLGTLQSGALADVIAVNGNPLQDINVLEKVDFVMKSGVVYMTQGRPVVQ